MNEELLRAIYENEGFADRGIDFEEFRSDMRNSAELRRAVFNNAGFAERGRTFDEFQTDLGIPAPTAPQNPEQTKSESEGNFLDLGILNNTMLGDWIDDQARAISRGNRSGDAIDETLTVMFRGSSVTPENIEEYIQATERSQELPQSDEMNEFMDAGGFETWDGWKKFFNNGATIVPEMIVESLSGLLLNRTSGTIVGGGVATGAAIGAGYGATAAGAGAVPGAVIGATRSVPIAIGAASGVLETSSKFGELLQEEVQSRGLEFDEEGVKTVLEDKESMRRMKNKALARGITIGTLDAITGRIAGTVGGKVATQGLRTSQKVSRVGRKFGVEVGGAAGTEFAAQVVAGEPLDITSIGLEAFAEIGTGAPNVFAPIIEDTYRNRLGVGTGTETDAATDADTEGTTDTETGARRRRGGLRGILGLNPREVEPEYKINGETVTREEARDVIGENMDEIANGNIDIRVKNDPELSKLIEDGLNERRTPGRPARGEAEGEDADAEAQDVDTPDVQRDQGVDDEADTDADDEAVERPEDQGDEPTDVTDEQDAENVEQTQIDDGTETERTVEGTEREGLADQEVAETTETQEQEAQDANLEGEQQVRPFSFDRIDEATDEQISERLDEVNERVISEPEEGSPTVRVANSKTPIVKSGDKYYYAKQDGTPSKREVKNQDAINEYEDTLRRKEALESERNRRDQEDINNQQNQEQDGLQETENEGPQEQDEGQQRTGEPIQRGDEDDAGTQTDPIQDPDERQPEPDDPQQLPPQDVDETATETESDANADRRFRDEARRDDAGTRPDPSAVRQARVVEAADRMQKKIEEGRTIDQAFDEIKGDYADLGMSEEALKTRVEAQRLSQEQKKRTDLNKDKAYANFTMNNWDKFVRWWNRNFRSRGILPEGVFELIEKKRGFIQSYSSRANTISKRLTDITRGLSEYDRQGVDKMLKGASSDVLSSDVDADTRREIRILTQSLRDIIDGLTDQMENLGVFNEPLIEVFRDNQGRYVTRAYMRNLDKNWPDKVPARVWEAAKKIYRDEMRNALQDGRVLESKKAQIVRYLSDDNAMDDLMRQILTGDQKAPVQVGGMQGTKDASIVRRRKDIPKEIREFYGEILDAPTNAMITVNKMASYIANTRLLDDLQRMGFEGDFISNTPRTDPDGRQWVEVNKSGSPGLTPLDSPIYIQPDIAKDLELVRAELPKWIDAALKFNGYVKAGKTILSPVTQVRNFWSATAWMVANGVYNPRDFLDAYNTLVGAGKVEGIDSKRGIIGKDQSIKGLNERWDRLVELQVANQSVVARELGDFVKAMRNDGLSIDVLFNNPASGRLLKWLATRPRQFYGAVDDFYRVAYYMNQEKKIAQSDYGKSVDELTEAERTYVEEEAARIVRNTYPNYSKIYPIVSKLRKIPFMGAFVSFSAEMLRTTRNQILQVADDYRKGRRKSAAQRALGLAVVTGMTAQGLEEAMEMFFGYKEDEDVEKDLIHYRAPWVESLIPVENKGNGKFLVINPSNINPYGYFSDIINAGRNEDVTSEALFQAFLKTVEPFLGPEVSVDVLLDQFIDYVNEDNPETRNKKLEKFARETIEGLQPGVLYTLDKIVNPELSSRDMMSGTTKGDKVSRELLNLVFGVRLSEMDVKTSFEISKGNRIVKEKRRARKDFNVTYYEELEKKRRERLSEMLADNPRRELTPAEEEEIRTLSISPGENEEVDKQYAESVEIYNAFLDEGRENASRMRRLGMSDDKILEAHKRVNFDRLRMNNAELDYILGRVDTKPPLIFEIYDTGGGGTTRSTRGTRRSRR